jgi:hypothetical protein
MHVLKGGGVVKKKSHLGSSKYVLFYLVILPLLVVVVTIVVIPAVRAEAYQCSPPNPCLNGPDVAVGASADDDAPVCSPIIIDTLSEGFHLTSANGGVIFDITGTGHPVQIAWTDGRFHNAFLALPGADGLVHNGKQLFGNFTPQPPSANPNGYIALAQYDKPENGGNGDGIIDSLDAVFSSLRLWIDENHDGICQANELHRLSELGVVSISLKYRESRRIDRYGNEFRYRGRINVTSQQENESQTDPIIYDVFLIAGKG